MASAPGSEGSRVHSDKPYACTFCSQAFNRHDHLRRHTNVHTKDDQYACPCGEIYVRKDHLAHHLKSCKIGRVRLESDPRRSRVKVARSKRACDQCAGAKSKCDSEDPCGRCRTRSGTCTYTRDGYVDPYQEYRIESAGAVRSVHEETNASATLPSVNVASAEIATSNAATTADQRSLAAWPLPGEGDVLSPDNSIPQSGRTPHERTPPEFDMFNPNALSLNATFDPSLDFSGDYTSAAWVFDPCAQIGPEVSFEDLFDLGEVPYNTVNLSQKPNVPQRGFSLEQCDPVEAKCVEIRALLQNSTPDLPEGLVSSCLSRTKILLCHSLYGKCFQYHFPIHHAPTHKFTEASPTLLLAMVLAGAHYATNVIDLATVFKFALRLLLVVQTQQCEIDLQPPDLSTLQACLIIAVLLACSRNPIANQSWSIHFPRLLSMCERMGGFRNEDVPNYKILTQETFDWHDWIRTESLRRLACQVFNQEMASCIFFDKPPSLSAWSTSITLPCHESAWEAETARGCLEELQRLPQQLTMSRALTMLQDCRDLNGPQLEVSGYGMFVLMGALHSFVFHLIGTETEPMFLNHRSRPRLNVDPFHLAEARMLMKRLQHNFSRSTLEAVANEIIEKNGGPAFKDLNSLLNAWHTSWDKRQFRDAESDGKTFSAHPLPFCQLAKLFLMLHLIDEQGLADEQWRVPKIRPGDTRSRFTKQEKIVSWLNILRIEVPSEGQPDAQSTAEGEGSRLSLLLSQYDS